MEISVKTAVYGVLNGNVGATVHNGAPPGSQLPYVDIDEYYADDWSTKTFVGEKAELRIHAWSKDRDECSTIMESIKTLLNRQTLTLSGQNFVDCLYLTRRSFTDADGIVRHGVIDFEITAHE